MLKDAVFCTYCAWSGLVDRQQDTCPMCNRQHLADLKQDVEVSA
jgi:RNA polymerase subunit RPABC4/transcription elongation factor Spt4